jgi:hypothetical protein
MNLIFLDIDGVLNDFERSWGEVPDYNPAFVPRCVQHLNLILRDTEAKLVLSSSWRNLIVAGHMSVYGFNVMLQSAGVRGEIIAHTRSEDDEDRWMEIAAYLREPWQVNRLQVKIDRYCILDDMSDAFGGRPGIQTNGSVGLTIYDAQQAIEILNQSYSSSDTTSRLAPEPTPQVSHQPWPLRP